MIIYYISLVLYYYIVYYKISKKSVSDSSFSNFLNLKRSITDIKAWSYNTAEDLGVVNLAITGEVDTNKQKFPKNGY